MESQVLNAAHVLSFNHWWLLATVPLSTWMFFKHTELMIGWDDDDEHMFGVKTTKPFHGDTGQNGSWWMADGIYDQHDMGLSKSCVYQYTRIIYGNFNGNIRSNHGILGYPMVPRWCTLARRLCKPQGAHLRLADAERQRKSAETAVLEDSGHRVSMGFRVSSRREAEFRFGVGLKLFVFCLNGDWSNQFDVYCGIWWELSSTTK